MGGAIGIWFGFEPGALGVGLVAARYAGEDVFGRIIASAIQTKGQVIYFQWFGKTYTIFDEAGLVKDGKIRIKNEDGTVTVIDMKTGKVTHEKPDDQNSQDKQQQKKTEPENPAERAEAEAKTPYDPWTGEGWWW